MSASHGGGASACAWPRPRLTSAPWAMATARRLGEGATARACAAGDSKLPRVCGGSSQASSKSLATAARGQAAAAGGNKLVGRRQAHGGDQAAACACLSACLTASQQSRGCS